jgi:hypothetical protein
MRTFAPNRTLSRLAAVIVVFVSLLLAGGHIARADDHEQPVGVYAISDAPRVVTVYWIHSGDGVFRFDIEEKTTNKGTTVDCPCGFGSEQKSIGDLQPSTPYQFRVCAVYDASDTDRACSDYTPPVPTMAPQASTTPQQPILPVVTGYVPKATSINISFSASGYPYDSYTVRIRQKAAPGAPDNLFRDIDVDNSDQANTLIGSLQPNTTYQVQVRGCSHDFFVILDCQDWGPLYEATTLSTTTDTSGAPPPAPTISRTSGNEFGIDVFWTPNSGYGKYVIQYQPQGAPAGVWTSVDAPTAGGFNQGNYSVSNLTPGTTYTLTLEACVSSVTYMVSGPVVGWNCSAPSAPVTATTQAPLTTGGGTLVPALLSLSAPTVTAGNSVTVTGSVFRSTGTVTLTLTGSSSTPTLGTATISQGGFSTTVTIPASTSPGSYKVHAADTGPQPDQADATLQVTAPGAKGSLTITDPGNGLTYTGVNFDYAFNLNGTNLTPGAVTIFLDSPTGRQVGTATVAADGSFKTSVTIATGQTSTGRHTLVAVQNGTTQASLSMTIETLEDVH